MIPRKQHTVENLDETVKMFRQGSAEAFSILYKAYQQRVYRYCVKMMGGEAPAKDAFQEAFMRVYEYRADFRGQNFPAWLFTIARNTCLNHIRKRKHSDTFEEDLHGKSFYTNRLQRTDVLMKDQINNAIQELPVKLREALILREYEEYSYREIAEITGIEVSLAKVRVHRARVQLRKALKHVVKEYNEA